jgi:ribosome-associated heat shock protein Hsp15
MTEVDHQGGGVRLDRWLWAARFFKTRSMAAQALTGGRVHLNGARVKAAHPVRVGDSVAIRRGAFESTVVVRALAVQRRSAPEAARLYEETAASKETRARLSDELRAQARAVDVHEGRVSKRARREGAAMRRGEHR